ncbi:hypothetical protein BUH_5991 [Burkholderia pseudomallei Pakistan 9]|nr:hypothetical protein BUH_5991 [Burkholderia pseudomallei Pakistan 9]
MSIMRRFAATCVAPSDGAANGPHTPSTRRARSPPVRPGDISRQ